MPLKGLQEQKKCLSIFNRNGMVIITLMYDQFLPSHIISFCIFIIYYNLFGYSPYL